MKKETKVLVEWIKAQIRIAAKLDDSYLITTAAIDAHKILEEDAEKFLDSLPEIESHLCCGGYIQDGFEKPCRAGDKIKDKEGAGVLYWSKSDFRFYIRRDSGELDLIHYPFIKVEV